MIMKRAQHWRGVARPAQPAPPLFLLQPLLAHIAAKVARRHPEVFARLGAHQSSCFVIAPRGLPFVLYLRPDPHKPVLRALPRHARPVSDARIAASLFRLLRMIDGEEDGDAMFFARDLVINGDTEAVVSLRNAIDDIDGSLAATVAGVFGLPGRAALTLLRRHARRCSP
jgi:predicted lipid carrier protein YhbT